MINTNITVNVGFDNVFSVPMMTSFLTGTPSPSALSISVIPVAHDGVTVPSFLAPSTLVSLTDFLPLTPFLSLPADGGGVLPFLPLAAFFNFLSITIS